MGLFKKKEEKNKFPKHKEKSIELPKLDNLPAELHLPKLPSFPSNSLGNKLSQDSIKESIYGEKEENEANDFVEEQMMPPLKHEIAPPLEIKPTEPIFIRIDKFEESLKTLKKTKEKISEIEKIFTEVKQLKEKEETELTNWESEIQKIKNQMEKIEEDIFSKVE
jgi:hypothetical protein